MEDLVCLTELEEPPSSGFSTVNLDSTQTVASRSQRRHLTEPTVIDQRSGNVIPIRSLSISKQTSLINNRTNNFRLQYFPTASEEDWNDWRWQLRHRIKTLVELERVISLSQAERDAFQMHAGPLPVGITPYYASLIHQKDPNHPIRRMVVMSKDEFRMSPGEADDPLGEDGHSPVPGLVHRYPDRVLFLVTGFCSVYCRYCTRSRLVGKSNHESKFNMQQWEAALQYIERTPVVRDVLLSGGDPLTLSNDKLEWLLRRLRKIPHVEIIRIGSKVPVVLPQRITPALTNMLKKYHPLWMSLHFSHPEEITPETTRACRMLAEAAIPLGSQTVLLKGINDSVQTMKKLYQGLLKILVKPYYLYQCDPVSGSAQFRTTVEKGLEIIEGLRGHTSGYAVPHYVIDAPGGGGKIPILPNYVVSHDKSDWTLRNYEHRSFHYPNPIEQPDNVLQTVEGGEPCM
ncbi:KamA family radical SAM protein [candidate division KSB1 bacterium]|nr:KamA family radical SAM protein [candidate division KSB1 bacterium]